MNRIALMVLRNIFKVPGLYAKLCRYAKNPDKFPEQERWDHIRHILQLGVSTGNLDLQVTGVDNIPAPGSGFMMYANHQGLFDILAITASFDKPWAAVMKKELYNLPMLKQMARCTKSLSLDREDVRQGLEVIRAVTKEVESGRNYLIFPEGTRSKQGNKLLEFHNGTFRCATKSKCVILPIALVNTYKVFDEKGTKPVEVEVHFLKPIPYEEYEGMNTMEVAELVRGRIAEVVEKHA